MKIKKTNTIEDNEEYEYKVAQFGYLTLYTDRIVDLINQNIIDYSSKSLNIIII